MIAIEVPQEPAPRESLVGVRHLPERWVCLKCQVDWWDPDGTCWSCETPGVPFRDGYGLGWTPATPMRGRPDLPDAED